MIPIPEKMELSFHGTMGQDAAERLRKFFREGEDNRHFSIEHDLDGWKTSVTGIGRYDAETGEFHVSQWTGETAAALAVAQVARMMGVDYRERPYAL